MTVVNRLLLVAFGVLFVCIHDDARANDADEPFRSWVVTDPLYEELLSNEPPGLRSQGSIIWGHLLDVPTGYMTARRFAIRYVSDDMHRDHAHAGFNLVASEPNRFDDLAAADRWQLKTIVDGPLRRTIVDGKLKFGWVVDPDNAAYYLNLVEYYFSMPRSHLMWGIYAGDEHSEGAVEAGAHLMEKPGDYPFIKTADAEVRRDFGGGRYGIPRGIKQRDPDPYKWIAYRRWIAAKMRDRHRRLQEIIRAKNPETLAVSVNAPGINYELHAAEFSSRAEFFDIITHQVGYPDGADRWRPTIGFVTKFIADLSGREAWPCVHIESCNYPDARPAEVVEEFSQVFRNGGTGLHLFLSDIRGAGKLVGDTRTTYFGSPRRYHTIMNICRHIRTMPKLKLPTYERMAIVYNDDTLAATPYDSVLPHSEYIEACYIMLGPVAESWFKFIDSAQILKWPSLNDRFDIIFLPGAKYQRPAIVNRLRDFVNAGGTLVCSDPAAFHTDLLGNDTVASRTEIFGVTVGEKVASKRLFPKAVESGKALPLLDDAYHLKPTGKVEVLATYDDGSPAITANRLGKGRAIFCGTPLFHRKAVPMAPWRDFFTAWVKHLGAPTGLDIWRFSLPDSLIWKAPVQHGVCLTNNRVLWQEETPHFTQNLDAKGTYSYTAAPDAMTDVTAENGTIAFAAGRLTDRRKGILAKKERPSSSADFVLPESHWMVSWARPEPVSIIFDLRAPRPLRQFKLWFCDKLPAVTVEGSSDGTQWQRLGSAEEVTAGADVYDLVIDLDSGQPSRYLRASFAERKLGEKLSLIEVEVWGERLEE